MPRKALYPLEQWPVLYRAIGETLDSSARAVCGRFLHWCRFAGYHPAELTQERAGIWLDAVGPRESRKSTRGVAGNIVARFLLRAHPEIDWAWLKALAAQESTRRKDGATYSHNKPEESLPVDQWPASWAQAWQRATGHLYVAPSKGKSRYSDLRIVGRKEWRRSYAEGIKNRIGGWLWIMHEAGLPIDLTRHSLQVFIQAKRELGVKEKWISGEVKKLAAGFRVVLGSCPQWVSATAVEMKDNYRANNHDDLIEERPEHPAVLAAIGLLLIERSRKFPLGSRKGVELFRDGALFFTLAYRAMRVSTVIQLKLGDHLKLGEEKGQICAPACIMKAKRAWKIDLNADIVAILKEWCDRHRAFVKNADSSPFVFVSCQPSMSGGMAAQSIGRIVRKHSKAYLARSLSTHDFRYATGTCALDELPDDPWIGTAMLQHHSRRTLTIYTPGYEMVSAVKLFGEIADGARKKAEQAIGRKAA